MEEEKVEIPVMSIPTYLLSSDEKKVKKAIQSKISHNKAYEMVKQSEGYKQRKIVRETFGSMKTYVNEYEKGILFQEKKRIYRDIRQLFLLNKKKYERVKKQMLQEFGKEWKLELLFKNIEAKEIKQEEVKALRPKVPKLKPYQALYWDTKKGISQLSLYGKKQLEQSIPDFMKGF